MERVTNVSYTHGGCFSDSKDLIDDEDIEAVVERPRLNRWLVGVRVNLRMAEAVMLISSNEERLPLSIVATDAQTKNNERLTAPNQDFKVLTPKIKGGKTRYMVVATGV